MLNKSQMPSFCCSVGSGALCRLFAFSFHAKLVPTAHDTVTIVCGLENYLLHNTLYTLYSFTRYILQNRICKNGENGHGSIRRSSASLTGPTGPSELETEQSAGDTNLPNRLNGDARSRCCLIENSENLVAAARRASGGSHKAVLLGRMRSPLPVEQIGP